MPVISSNLQKNAAIAVNDVERSLDDNVAQQRGIPLARSQDDNVATIHKCKFLHAVESDVSIYNVAAFALAESNCPVFILVRCFACVIMQLVIVPIMALSELANDSQLAHHEYPMCKNNGTVEGKVTGFTVMIILACVFHKYDIQYTAQIKNGIPKYATARFYFYILGLYTNVWANYVATLGGVVLAYVQIAPTFIVIRYLCVQFATGIDELVCDHQDAAALKKAVEVHRTLLKRKQRDGNGEGAEVLEVITEEEVTGVLKFFNATIKVLSVVIGGIMLCSPVWFAVCW